MKITFKFLIGVVAITLIFFNCISQNKGKLKAFIQQAAEMQEQADAKATMDKKYIDSLNLARPGYETKSNVYYNHDLADLPLKGYYILNNGQKIDAIIAYLKPQFLIGMSNALLICNEETGKKVDHLNTHLEPNFKEWVKYEDIRCFYVADQLFARHPKGYFTIIVTEGAIQTTTSLKMTDQSKQFFKVFPVTHKLNGPAFGSVNRGINETELLGLMADNPAIVNGYKNG